MTTRVAYCALLGLLLFFLALEPVAARAQAAPEQCAGISGVNEPTNAEVHGCLKPIVDYHALLSVSDAVRRVVAGRLVSDSEEEPGPAGLLLERSEHVAGRLAGGGTIAVEPVADIPAVAAQQRLWNAWIDGKYSWIEGKSEIDHSQGPLTNVMLGVDYRLTDRFVLGLIATYEDSLLETGGLLPIEQKTEGFGAGAYVGVTVTPNIILSAMAIYAGIDTELDGSSEAETDSDRVQVSGAFTGYWYSGTTRFSPSLTLAWSKEWQDEYSDGLTPAQQFETGVLSAGAVIGRTFVSTGTTSIEPWLGAFLDYTFINDTHTDGGFGVESYDEQADLRLQLGLNLNVAANVQLMLTGETSGLLVDESDTYAGEANLAIQF